MKVKVVTDSGGGLTKKQADELNIGFLPLQVIINDKTYLDGVDLGVQELYDMIEKGYLPQTSMPPLGMIEQMFEDYKEEGITDVILVSLSSGLSGTNEAVQASGKWHGVKVHTLDICTTLGVQRYLALAANNLVEKGYQPERIIHRLQEAVDDSEGFLVCEDLNHLVRGGRLTPVAAKLAGMLKIKPILVVSKETEGKVGLYDKVRTMSKAIKKACKQIEKGVKNPEDYHLIILDSNAKENRDLAKEEFMDSFGPDVTISFEPIYSVIAAHTGLGAVGVQYVKKVRGAD